MFKKPKSKLTPRGREKSPEDTSQTTSGNGETVDESPIALASRLKNKAKRTKPKSTLSFGGDEEAGDGEVFQLKKSSLSQKLSLSAHPANVLPVSLDQATITPHSNGAPVYDQAYLSQLKASTPSSRRATVAEGYDADVSMDPGETSIEVTEIADDVDTMIPSESSILSAKQRRERMRTHGTEDDFISLSVTKRDTVPQGPHPESRLMREEDELGEGDDEYAEYTSAQERIALGKKSKKLEASKRKDAMQEMIADADEEDEETMEWEKEQLRRGGPFQTSHKVSPAKQVYKPAAIPTSTTIPSLGPAMDRLSQSLTAMTTSHTTNVKAAASFVDEREQLDVRESELREMIAKAEAKRSWFAAFKEWVENVATFLDEKFPKLEKLEDEFVSILKERSAMIAQRRQADNQDDLSLIFGSLLVATDQSEEVDDLGRVLPRANPVTVRRERQAARIARRLHRERGRATRAIITQLDREEGYSTDSSLPPSDAIDYQSAMERIANDGHGLLSDVHAAEFRDPSLGLAKWFGGWRRRFSDSYTGAWGGLGLVGAWEFWVRLELLGWNPFENSHTLDEFSWCASLHEYCGDNDDPESDTGPNDDLVSAMISTAVVPLICKVVEAGALDSYSALDTRNMINLAEQVEASIGHDNPKFQMILKSVFSVFERSVSASESLIAPFVALNCPVFDPDAIAARRRLLCHASKFLNTLIQWRKYTGEKLGIDDLCIRHMNNVVLPIAESGWEVGGEEITREMIAIMPYEVIRALKAPLNSLAS
ncbi:GCFC-domain-containing protein [Suillus fuscotomentosus]|uniref:GCFC-domain-containing protein n=1 Tax=Suillus fuscotomentosus TaxID=1912939 RepID=A0AAD4EI68_9AGAM|nr:GCFC-domain-containing protein [Suillus fuscotomentosus]KAG1906541.1 GCFC-domain-containing protein [Suillus fuscotomentosus]